MYERPVLRGLIQARVAVRILLNEWFEDILTFALEENKDETVTRLISMPTRARSLSLLEKHPGALRTAVFWSSNEQVLKPRFLIRQPDLAFISKACSRAVFKTVLRREVRRKTPLDYNGFEIVMEMICADPDWGDLAVLVSTDTLAGGGILSLQVLRPLRCSTKRAGVCEVGVGAESPRPA